jgi:hypothetical protein
MAELNLLRLEISHVMDSARRLALDDVLELLAEADLRVTQHSRRA